MTQSLERITDELAQLRRPGIGRPLGTIHASTLPVIATIAQQTAVDPTLSLTRLIEVAVRKALSGVHPSQARLAAAALLWIDLSDSEPPVSERMRKPVSQRRKQAAALLGISARTFERRHERPLLEQVGEQLLSLDAAPPRRSRSHEPSQRRPDNVYGMAYEDLLEALAANSLRLHTACLIALFVVTLDQELAQEFPDGLLESFYSPDGPHVERQCARLVYEAHQAFCEFAPFVSPPSVPHFESMAEVLPTEMFNRIYPPDEEHRLQRQREVAETAPRQSLFDESIETELEQLRAEIIESFTRFMGTKVVVSPPEAIRRERQDGMLTGAKDIELVNWYREAVGYKLSPFGTGWSQGPDTEPLWIERLAGKAGRIEKRIRVVVDYINPLVSRNRQFAVKMINSFYVWDEWRPIAGGLSLRGRVERFLDSGSTSLDREENVWYK
jgi:hypothetical protein